MGFGGSKHAIFNPYIWWMNIKKYQEHAQQPFGPQGTRLLDLLASTLDLCVRENCCDHYGAALLGPYQTPRVNSHQNPQRLGTTFFFAWHNMLKFAQLGPPEAWDMLIGPILGVNFRIAWMILMKWMALPIFDGKNQDIRKFGGISNFDLYVASRYDPCLLEASSGSRSSQADESFDSGLERAKLREDYEAAMQCRVMRRIYPYCPDLWLSQRDSHGDLHGSDLPTCYKHNMYIKYKYYMYVYVYIYMYIYIYICMYIRTHIHEYTIKVQNIILPLIRLHFTSHCITRHDMT